MDNIDKIFLNFGITPKETRIYISALELGPSLPKLLAAHAKVKRTTLYEMLPNLYSKGLLEQTIRGKRRYLLPSSPEKVIAKKSADLELLQNSKLELNTIFEKSSERPRIIFFEGIEGIKKLYEDILQTKRNARAFIGVSNINQELFDWLHEYYEPIRIKNQIFSRNIVNEIEELERKLPSSKEKLRENRVIPEKIYPIKIEMVIYGDKVGYMTIRKDSVPAALLIENPEIADSMKSIFELAWKVSQRVK